MWCVEDCEFRRMRCKLFIRWTNEHVSSKSTVPCIVCDDSNRKCFARLSTTGQILDEQGVLLGKEVNDLGSHTLKRGKVGRDIDITPVDVVVRGFFVDDVLVVR